jgi:triphosphoribosyl-dephospho-CoA synthetase
MMETAIRVIIRGIILEERLFMDLIPPSCVTYTPADFVPPGLDCFCTAFGALAALATFEEVTLSPKPGLVCPDSSGSHTDMNWVTFIMGASALVPFWRRQVMDGVRMGHYKPLRRVMERLRETGLEMERAMYKATGGVNTHKGLIFALSLLLGAAGLCARRGEFAREQIFETSGRLIAPSVEEELDRLRQKGKRGEELTHGEKINLLHGIGGIRTEAARGFPSVRVGLEAFENAILAGAAYRDAAIKALLTLMAECEDTNVIHRGGIDFWLGEYKDLVRETTRNFDPLEPERYESISELERLLIMRGVSPGGAADMLACTLFMYRSKMLGNITLVCNVYKGGL